VNLALLVFASSCTKRYANALSEGGYSSLTFISMGCFSRKDLVANFGVLPGHAAPILRAMQVEKIWGGSMYCLWVIVVIVDAPCHSQYMYYDRLKCSLTHSLTRFYLSPTLVLGVRFPVAH
jgi:hypothetical protein